VIGLVLAMLIAGYILAYAGWVGRSPWELIRASARKQGR
jgi:hypothetical protein